MSRNAVLLLLLLPMLIALFSQSYLQPLSFSSSSPLRSFLHRILPHRTSHSTTGNRTGSESRLHHKLSASHSHAHPSSEELLSSAWPLMNNTAEAVALMRYIAAKEQQLPVEEEIVLEMLLPAHIKDMARTEAGRQQLKKRMMPNTYETILGRTRYIDGVLTDVIQPSTAAPTSAVGRHRPRPRPIEQLVILGAGGDTRAVRLYEQLADAGVVVFEVDVPDPQMAKQNKLLRAIAQGKQVNKKTDLSAAYDNTRFVPLNLTAGAAQPSHAHTRSSAAEKATDTPSALFVALEAAGFDGTKPTMFLLEGLAPYLPPNAVNDTLHSLHHHAPPASVLVMDYFAPTPACKQDELDIVIEQVADLGEPILFKIETEVDRDADFPAAHKHQVQALLSKNGWHLVELVEPEELTKRHITQPTRTRREAADGEVGGAGGVEGEVACFEHIVAAINKPVEVDIEIIEP